MDDDPEAEAKARQQRKRWREFKDWYKSTPTARQEFLKRRTTGAMAWLANNVPDVHVRKVR